MGTEPIKRALDAVITMIKSEIECEDQNNGPSPKTQKDRNARPVNPVMIETIRIPK